MNQANDGHRDRLLAQSVYLSFYSASAAGKDYPRQPRQQARRAEEVNSKKLAGAGGPIETLEANSKQRATQKRSFLDKRLRSRKVLTAHRATQNKTGR